MTREEAAAADRHAAQDFADQHGPTFIRLAIRQAKSEGLLLGQMTTEELLDRAATVFLDKVNITEDTIAEAIEDLRARG